MLFDIAAWLVIHLAIAWAAAKLPLHRLDPAMALFRPLPWERQGQVYVEVFQIKRWKAYLPDAAPLFGRMGFPKRRLAATDTSYLHRFVRESCRAELTHWLILGCGPLFLLWNRPAVGVAMIVYALLENAPLIAAQRYNRHRLLQALASRLARDDRRRAR